MARSRSSAAGAAGLFAALLIAVAIPGAATAADPPQPCGFYHTSRGSEGATSLAYYRNCSYLSVHHVKVDVVLAKDRGLCVARKHTEYLGVYGTTVMGDIRGAKHDYDC